MATALKAKLASLKEACNPRTIYARDKHCDTHLYAVTFWACLSFIGLGGAVSVFGPTLLDFAEYLGVGIELLAIMFTCRAIGGAVGSVCSGIVMDKLEHYSSTILCLIYIFCIGTTAMIPFSVHIVMLGVFMTLNGVAIGCIDNGTHSVLIKLWRDKAGPCMQVLHFCFALGAFVSPLVAKRFVSERYNDDNSTITLDCGEVLNDSLSPEQIRIFDTIEYNNVSVCFDKIYSLCFNLTSTSEVIVTENCTTTEVTSNFAWAYWIGSTLFVPSLIAFIYFAFTKEMSKKCCKRKVDAPTENTKSDSNATATNKRTKQAYWFIVVMFTLLFIFMFVYVGLEVAYGSLIFTVAVEGELNFTKSDAAILTSLFWGSFAFFRLFSVLLAIFKVRSSVMMAGNLSGSFLGSLILVFYPHNPTAVWIGSAVLGASYASIYPTTMTWMSENTVATAKATSVLVAAGTLGDISIPSIVGIIIAKVSPDALLYITFSGILVSAMVVSVLFLVTCLYKRSAWGRRKSRRRAIRLVKYKRLENDDLTEDFHSTEQSSVNESHNTFL